MKQNNPNIHSFLSTFRIETLEDGVFSIAMTLLVLNLKLPEKLDQSVFLAIVKIWPNLITFFGSFLLLGVYWFGHRTALHYIKYADHVFHWLNIFLLMFVSIVPFSSSVIAKYYYDRGAIILYGINLIAIGLTMYLQWSYATLDYRLTEKDLSPVIVRYAKIRCIFAPMVYLLAICLSFLNITIPLILYTVIPIFYTLPVFLPIWARMAEKSTIQSNVIR